MRPRRVVLFLAIGLTLGGCGGAASEDDVSSITLYTCVGEPTAKAIIDGFTKERTGAKVDLFRAPTGQLNARVAGDVRSGGLRADVLWTCDPLTMYGYAGEGFVRPWMPPNVSDIPVQYRTADFVGVDLLYLVAVVHDGTQVPRTWRDLTGPAYKDSVALPDPSFAASALGMLGYFSSADGYGIQYYRDLKANGAVQLKSPDDVLTGVAQGTYHAGFVLATAAALAKSKGSPIQLVWPRPGAIAIYAPIAVTNKAGDHRLAEDFASYVASRRGQELIAKSNVYPVLPGTGGPVIPPGTPIVAPDWSSLAGGSLELTSKYRKIFKG